MSIRQFLGLKDAGGEAQAAPSAETTTVRKIVAALDALEPDRARFIAAFAYILSRVANADLNIGQQETGAMESLVRDRAGLPEEQAVLVVQMAKSQSRLFGGTENFLVTREFARQATTDQKRALLQCLFAVSAADASISTAEDNEIRRISRELRLGHDDFIAARTAFRDHLAVLKGGRRPAG